MGVALIGLAVALLSLGLSFYVCFREITRKPRDLRQWENGHEIRYGKDESGNLIKWVGNKRYLESVGCPGVWREIQGQVKSPVHPPLPYPMSVGEQPPLRSPVEVGPDRLSQTEFHQVVGAVFASAAERRRRSAKR